MKNLKPYLLHMTIHTLRKFDKRIPDFLVTGGKRESFATYSIWGKDTKTRDYVFLKFVEGNLFSVETGISEDVAKFKFKVLMEMN